MQAFGNLIIMLNGKFLIQRNLNFVVFICMCACVWVGYNFFTAGKTSICIELLNFARIIVHTEVGNFVD